MKASIRLSYIADREQKACCVHERRIPFARSMQVEAIPLHNRQHRMLFCDTAATARSHSKAPSSGLSSAERTPCVGGKNIPSFGFVASCNHRTLCFNSMGTVFRTIYFIRCGPMSV